MVVTSCISLCFLSGRCFALPASPCVLSFWLISYTVSTQLPARNLTHHWTLPSKLGFSSPLPPVLLPAASLETLNLRLVKYSAAQSTIPSPSWKSASLHVSSQDLCCKYWLCCVCLRTVCDVILRCCLGFLFSVILCSIDDMCLIPKQRPVWHVLNVQKIF